MTRFTIIQHTSIRRASDIGYGPNPQIGAAIELQRSVSGLGLSDGAYEVAGFVDADDAEGAYVASQNDFAPGGSWAAGRRSTSVGDIIASDAEVAMVAIAGFTTLNAQGIVSRRVATLVAAVEPEQQDDGPEFVDDITGTENDWSDRADAQRAFFN